MSTKKCVVCGWEIKEDGSTVTVNGKKLPVCCDDCAAKVKANPNKYTGKGKS